MNLNSLNLKFIIGIIYLSVISIGLYFLFSAIDVKDLMSRAGQPVSLETKIGDGEETVLLELLSSEGELPQKKVEEDCMKSDLEGILQKLPEMQHRVLRMRYGMDGEEPNTLTGIGRILGISRDRVRNLERDALRGLRRYGGSVEAYMAC